jgi:hypothetical protein
MGSFGMMTMNTQPPIDDDWLEQALRADAREHAASYLPDDGFTAQVLGGLPPRPAALPSWRRPVLWTLWAIVAIAVIAALPIWFEDVFSSMAATFVGQRLRFSDVAVLLTLLGGVTWSTLFFAARTE